MGEPFPRSGDDPAAEPGSEAFEDLLVAAIDRYEAGGRAAFDAFCRIHPRQAAALRLEVEKLLALGMVDAGPRPLPDDLPPVLGDFRLLRRLSGGATAAVYLAEQESLRRQVVLKVEREPTEASAGESSALRAEAEALARLRHDHIVKVIALGRCSDPTGGGTLHYMATELVPGEGLDARLEAARRAGTRLPVADVLTFGHTLARALHHAHQAGLVHGDVKPGNVRITPAGSAVLIDFGLVRRAGRAEATHGLTPNYAAPELSQTGRKIDGRSDVFALGVTLCECLARSGRGADGIESARQRVLAASSASHAFDLADLPRDLSTVLDKATARAPSARYADAEALAADLEAVLRFEPIAARPPGPARRLLRWAKRHAVAATAVATACVGAAAVTALWLVATRREARARAQLVQRGVQLAEVQLTTMAAEAAAADALRAQLRSLDSALEERLFGDDEEAELRHLAAGLAAHEGARDDAFLTAVRHAWAAIGASRDGRGGRSVLARAHFERWRQATRAGEGSTADDHRRVVASLRPDLDPATSAALDFATQRVTITAEPPARVFLFRYRAHTELADDGEPRLVPVPIGGADPEVLPGTHALRVVQAREGLEWGDLVVRLAGHALAGAVLVLEGGGAVPALARLERVDDQPARSLAQALAAARPPGPHRFVFVRDGREHVVVGASLTDLGIRLADPCTVVEQRPAALRVPALVETRFGQRQLDLPPGLYVRPTAAPLPLGPTSDVGTTPCERRLEPGAYLAVLEAAGCTPQRLPFSVRDGRDEHLAVRLVAEAEAPAGFAYVPADAVQPGTASFFIQEREVTVADFLAFRDVESIRVRQAPDLPVTSVSFDDAVAYAAWRTERARAQGQRLEFTLPTPAQWLLAASLPDDRPFAFGREFWPRFAASGRSGPSVLLEAPFSHPIDESPCGVYDLTGSVNEWCLGELLGDRRPFMGGAFNKVEAADFVLQNVRGSRGYLTGIEAGFRLVALPVP